MKKGGQKNRKKHEKKYEKSYDPVDTTDDSEADRKTPPPKKKKKNKLFEEELQIEVKHEGVERDVRKLVVDGYFWGYYTAEALENIQIRIEESGNLEAHKTKLIGQFESEKYEFQSKLLVQFEDAKGQLEMETVKLTRENELLVRKNAALTLQLKEQIEVNKSLIVTSMNHMEMLSEKWTEEETSRKRRREIPSQADPINID